VGSNPLCFDLRQKEGSLWDCKSAPLCKGSWQNEVLTEGLSKTKANQKPKTCLNTPQSAIRLTAPLCFGKAEKEGAFFVFLYMSVNGGFVLLYYGVAGRETL